MALIHNLEKKCAICGSKHHYQKIATSNNIGMRDLDTRSPGLMRNMIHLLIEKCPNCGYCNTDVSKKIIDFNEDEIKNEKYQSILNDDSINFAIKKFVLYALLHINRNYRIAGMSFLKAAWMADDAKKAKEARLLRSKAIKYLELALENDEEEYIENINLIIVDLYRRIGMFEEAIECTKYLLNNFGMEKYKQNILLYQIKLCQDEDLLDHTIPGNYNFYVDRASDNE